MTFIRGIQRRLRAGITRPEVGAAAVVIGSALLLTGCAGDQQTGQAASRDAVSSPSPAACARDEPYYQAGLLQTEDVWSQPGRSQETTTVVELDPKACTTGSKPAKVPTTSCEPGAFPWTTSAASASRELAGAGVRARGDVTFTAKGKTLQEIVLASSPSEQRPSIVAAYRDHLEGCKAQAVGGLGGKPEWFRIATASNQLLVSLDDGVVIALRAERSQWTDDELGELMRAAEGRSEKFRE
ncbi:hypothetical protein [Streptomyces sp. bgisy032]|uniref:hypothetical protein n=1 Tax=Streptomyces sp. bgisy032 TaxID=3413773 RepID=UPI003D760FAF